MRAGYVLYRTLVLGNAVCSSFTWTTHAVDPQWLPFIYPSTVDEQQSQHVGFAD